MRRRSALGLLILTLAACAPVDPPSVAEVPVSSAPAGEIGGVSFRAIAPGVWLHTAHHTVAGFGSVVSNGLVVEHGDHAVLVDTAWSDEQTRAILQWARDELRRPIQAAVVTHAHGDKMGGMAALHDAGVQTFAFRLTNADAAPRGLIPAAVPLEFDARGWLTPASAKAAVPLGPLRIYYPGPGHTRDNIIVGVPAAGMLFGGCLIRPSGSTGMGNTADGDLTHWDDAAEAAAAAFPHAELIVPSHGPPAGRELLDLTASLARAATAIK